jgi:hypothetical protein
MAGVVVNKDPGVVNNLPRATGTCPGFVKSEYWTAMLLLHEEDGGVIQRSLGSIAIRERSELTSACG